VPIFPEKGRGSLGEAHIGATMRCIALLPVILILGGCTSDAEIARQQAAADDAKCISDGAKAGEPAYTQCRAQLDAARKQVAATEAASQGLSKTGPCFTLGSSEVTELHRPL
jgi:hypothetical protein